MLNVTDAQTAVLALTSTGDALKADLLKIAKDVSIAAKGVAADAVTVLYSGTGDIVDTMLGDPNIRVINKTDVADLLISDEFKDKVAQAFGLADTKALEGAGRTHPANGSTRKPKVLGHNRPCVL